jgi:peptidyl-prolyl cis-trans isomerase B (cyclophilin B)
MPPTYPGSDGRPGRDPLWQGVPVNKLSLMLSVLVAAALLPACGTGPTTPAASASASASAPSASAPASPAAATGVSCTYRPTGDAAKKVTAPPATDVADTGTLAYVVKLNDRQVPVTLDRAKTPCTVNSFVSLAQQGYFDGTSCHRLVNGPGLFVLQCGDPTGSGSGSPGYEFDDELSGSETYPAGTLAMANAGPGTNGSQFFIVYADSQLSPNYTVFGHTDAAGIAVLKKIGDGGQDGSYPDGSGKPVLPAVITGVVAG